jgi:hypothetical protein
MLRSVGPGALGHSGLRCVAMKMVPKRCSFSMDGPSGGP